MYSYVHPQIFLYTVILQRLSTYEIHHIHHMVVSSTSFIDCCSLFALSAMSVSLQNSEGQEPVLWWYNGNTWSTISSFEILLLLMKSSVSFSCSLTSGYLLSLICQNFLMVTNHNSLDIHVKWYNLLFRASGEILEFLDYYLS